jgi:putative FmdB family regulatory protein
MPFYEYQCKNCGHDLEAMQKINDAPLKKCPHCGKSQLQRLMSAPVFRLKGGGWYETDFKGDGDNKKNLADKPEADASKDAAKDGDKDKGKDSAKEASKEGAAPGVDGKGKEGKDGKAAEAGGAKDAAAAKAKADDKPAAKATEPAKKSKASLRSVRGRAARPVRKPAAKAKRRR